MDTGFTEYIRTKCLPHMEKRLTQCARTFRNATHLKKSIMLLRTVDSFNSCEENIFFTVETYSDDLTEVIVRIKSTTFIDEVFGLVFKYNPYYDNFKVFLKLDNQKEIDYLSKYYK